MPRPSDGCLPCWPADAGLPSNGLRPAQRQGVAEGALLRSAFEQRGGHKIILPSLAVLSPGLAAGQPLSLPPATSSHSRWSESSAVAAAMLAGIALVLAGIALTRRQRKPANGAPT